MPNNYRQAFSLIELMVVVSIIALLIALLLPSLNVARRAARQSVCVANFQQFGRSYASYANDFRGFIAALHGEINDPEAIRDHTEHKVIARQVQYIINNFDGRRPSPIKDFGSANANLGISAPTGITVPSIAEQFEHMALFGYSSEEIMLAAAVCPEDKARLQWRRSPFNPEAWDRRPMKPHNQQSMEWMPYSSSYQLTPAAAAYSFFTWENTGASYAQGPSHDTYNLWKVRFGFRKMFEVSYPSGKVAMMDSQQRHLGNDLFYAYSEAKQPLLFWDGAVSLRQTSGANKGWLPRTPKTLEATKFHYIPDIGFESARRGTEPVLGYYRWTRAGLHGIDYGGSEISGTVGEKRAWQL